MKSKFLLFVFLGIVVFYTGCKDKNDVSGDATLNGTWKLKNVNGGLAGINIDYQEGDVYWTFNTNNGKLEVVNNIETTGPEDIYAGFDTGTYNFEIKQEGADELLYVNETMQGVIILSQENLVLDEGIAADGIQKEFIR